MDITKAKSILEEQISVMQLALSVLNGTYQAEFTSLAQAQEDNSFRLAENVALQAQVDTANQEIITKNTEIAAKDVLLAEKEAIIAQKENEIALLAPTEIPVTETPI